MSSILLEVEYGDVGFYDKRKTREPDEKPSEQEREPTTNSTHIWQRAGIKVGPHYYGKIFVRDHSGQCPVQFLKNIGPAKEQYDWLSLVIGPLN